MARQNTKLESEGAEFLVLAHLLINGIAAYKTYTNMKGYDLVATNPTCGTSVRISVKSRWRTKAEGFIIKNFDCDFVVVVKLNRGSKKGNAKATSPQFLIIPVETIKSFKRSKKFSKILFRDIRQQVPDYDQQFEDRWDLVRNALERMPLLEATEVTAGSNA